MRFFPTHIDFKEGADVFIRNILDMKGTQIVRGEKDKVVMGYSNIEKTF